MKKSPFHRLLTLLHCALIPSILAVGGFCSVVLPKPTVSDYERRELAKFPEFSLEALFSGSFTSELELFYADTFPLRESLVKLGAQLEDLRGVRMDDIRIHETGPASQDTAVPPSAVSPSSEAAIPGTDTPPAPGVPESAASSQASEPVQSSAPPVQPADDPNAPAPEQYNSILVYQNRAMAPFGGTEAMAGYYASVLSQYQETLGNEATIYNLLVPTSVEFYLPDKYKSVTNSQKASIDYIYSQLDPRIKRVDAYSALAQHTDEYLYFATDHHWTALGAYYAYTAFAQEAGFTPKSLDEMEKHTISPFIGTMYNQTQDPKLLENPDYVDYYITDTGHQAYQYVKNSPYYGNPVSVWAEYAKGGNSYSVFLHGDYPLTRIDTSHKNGRRIMVVKESFGNAFAPYLIPHYEQVFVVDARYFQINGEKFIQDNGINEILFINNIFAANTSSQIGYIQRILTQSDWYYQESSSESASQSAESESSSRSGVIVVKPKGEASGESAESGGTGSSSNKITVKGK